MTIEIKVGPPIITISQGRTFMVTDESGYIAADSDQASTRSIHASLVSISSTSTVSPGTRSIPVSSRSTPRVHI